MDIYGFFNSKDIAEYLKGMDYEFTLPEAAFIVYLSEYRTLEDKFEAWNEMIETMPDCSMGKRVNMHPIKSFHKFLRDYMALQEKLLRMLCDAGGALYTYDLYERCGWSTREKGSEPEDENIVRVELGTYFADAESALAHFEQEFKENEEEGVQRVRLLKKPLLKKTDLERNGEMAVAMTPDRKVISVDWIDPFILSDEEDALYRQFDGMCFAFPTPFKAGDILIDRTFESRSGKPGPFVLSCINTWDAETLLKNGFSPRHSWAKNADMGLEKMLQSADISDMHYHGYYMDSEGPGLPVLCEDAWYTYLNLEYYKAPLQGVDRVLKAFGNAIKTDPEDGEPLIGPSLLCNAYQQIVNEEIVESNRQFLEAWYTDEGLELAGLK
ncbi:MAG: hypothetical protein LUD72_12330 [Bacteroidales bacterium]|nr:hypothetical protein [Bacteroidales bacterium]